MPTEIGHVNYYKVYKSRDICPLLYFLFSYIHDIAPISIYWYLSHKDINYYILELVNFSNQTFRQVWLCFWLYS